MWVPKFKYLKGLFAQKGIFKLPDGSDYEGPYHVDEKGRSMTGDYPTETSVQIIEDPAEPSQQLEEDYASFVSEVVYPSPEDYKRGYFIRYFLKNKIERKIIEVNLQSYSQKKKELYIIAVEVKWILEKPVKDIFNQGYVFKGAASRNKENVLKASLLMPGLDILITNYAQFADIESDVEGYKFEELPPKEQRRIITSSVPNLATKPVRKIKPQKPPYKKPLVVASTLPNPRRSGGGGGGGYETSIFSEDGSGNGFDPNDNIMQY